jgi:hypothetical protein
MSGCPPRFKQTLTDLLALVAITKSVIDKFFPPMKVSAPYISNMEYSIGVPPKMYMLLVYMELYPGRKLEQTCVLDLLNLKDIYLVMNVPWNDDPILANAVKNGLI